MPQDPDNILSFHTLYKSTVVTVHDYQCTADRSGPQAEEFAEENQIVLMRHGTFCRHFGKQSVASDLNQTVFFSKGSHYRVSHPAECGDRGTIIEPSAELLSDILNELAPEFAADNDFSFPFATGPCGSQTFLKHKQLVHKLEKYRTESHRHDSVRVQTNQLDAEEAAIELVQQVLQAAFAQNESSSSKRRRKASTKSTHAEQVESAKTYIADHLSEQIKLEDLAQAAYVSPFHLSRLFKQHTGMSIHQYVIQLRLRSSLELLCHEPPAAATDLSTLALDLGFSSHSHFSDSFRRQFNCSPSMLKGDTQLIHDLSKILKV